MAATYMLRKHLASMEAAERPAAVAERRVHLQACERAGADRKREFPNITPDNFEEADAFQKERLAYWKTELQN